MALVARAVLWILQCVNFACGATCLICVTTPPCLPVIAAAPSEQTPTQFCQFISFEMMKSSTFLNISVAVVRPDKGSQILQLTVQIHT